MTASSRGCLEATVSFPLVFDMFGMAVCRGGGVGSGDGLGCSGWVEDELKGMRFGE